MPLCQALLSRTGGVRHLGVGLSVCGSSMISSSPGRTELSKSLSTKQHHARGQPWVWLQQMVLSVDGEGRRVGYQTPTSGAQGPGQAVSNMDELFRATFPCREMEPVCFPSSSLRALVLVLRPPFLSTQTLISGACSTWPSWAQLVYPGPTEYL